MIPAPEIRHNKGVWAEPLLKIHFLFQGNIRNINGSIDYFDSLEDHSVNGTIKRLVMSGSSPDHPLIERLYAESVVTVKKGSNGGRVFPVPSILEAMGVLGISELKAKSDNAGKADVILWRGNERFVFHVENTDAKEASFLNAGGPRFIFEVCYADRTLTHEEMIEFVGRFGESVKDAKGHRANKTMHLAMLREGLVFKLHSIPNEGFRDRFDARVLNDVVELFLCFLRTPKVAAIRSIFPIYEASKLRTAMTKDEKAKAQRRLDKLRTEFLRYIKDSIRSTTPTGVVREIDATNGGMIFLYSGNFYLVDPNEEAWWTKKIYVCGRFDPPSGGKHGYGFLYLKEGKLLYDYVLGIRGSFANALKEELAAAHAAHESHNGRLS